MNINELDGIISPLITPFNDDGSLDEVSLKTLINHVIAGGVNGIFILGTTGEFASMAYELKEDLIKKTCELVRKRVAVLVGVSSSDFAETLSLAAFSQECGADAIVASPPLYYPLGQNELLLYFKKLANDIKLPLYVYNMPALTKVVIEPETVKALASTEGIIGFKDSSANMIYLKEVIAAVSSEKGFQVFIGPEEKLDLALALGASGGVNGGSNLFPERYVKLYEAFQKGEHDQVEKLQHQIYQISENIYHLSEEPTAYLQGLKAALSLKGLCKNKLLFPLQGFNVDQLQEMSSRLSKIG